MPINTKHKHLLNYLTQDYPSDYTGSKLLQCVTIDAGSLITRPRKSPTPTNAKIVVIDNVNRDVMNWYEVDLIDQPDVFLTTVSTWKQQNSDIPLSVYLSKVGLTDVYHHAYQMCNRSVINMVIGDVPYYDMLGDKGRGKRYIPTVKRKQNKPTEKRHALDTVYHFNLSD